MSNPRNRHHEPSIEEVLASIRRVVTADRAQVFGADTNAAEAVMVTDKNEIINLKPMSKYTNEASAAEARQVEYPSHDPADSDRSQSGGDQAGHQARSAGFQSVVEPAVDSFMASASIAPMLREWLDQNLPEMVEQRLKTLLRPLLKDWFDAHLPTMVDRIVRDEVERIVSASGNN